LRREAMLSRVIYRKISRYTNSYIGAESISLSYRRRLGLQKVTSIGFATKSNITRNYGKISASYFRRAIKRIYKIITKALSLGKKTATIEIKSHCSNQLRLAERYVGEIGIPRGPT